MVLLISILLAALIVRYLYFITLSQEPEAYFLQQDAEFKDYWARAIATGDWTPPHGKLSPFIPDFPSPNPPAYSWFLAIVYRFVSSSITFVQVLQLCLGLVNVFLIYVIGRRLFGTGAGLLSALGGAFYWAFVYYEGEINQLAVVIFFWLAASYVWLRWLDAPKLPYLAFCGVLWGILILLRSEFFVILPIPIIWIIVTHAWCFGRVLPGIAGAAVWLVAVFTVMLPVSLRNLDIAKSPFTISWGSELALYIASGPDFKGYDSYTEDLMRHTEDGVMEIFTFPRMVYNFNREHFGEQVPYWRFRNHLLRQGWEFISRNPGTFLERLIVKAALFYGPAEIDENKVIEYDRRHLAPLPHLLRFPPVMSLFLLGLIIYCRDRIRMARKRGLSKTDVAGSLFSALCVVFVVGYSLLFILLVVRGRYRIPVIPFMLLFGGYGLHYVLQRIRERRLKESFAWAMIFLCLFWAASRPWIPYSPDVSRWHDERRKAWAAEDRLENGIADIQRWLDRNPGDPYGYYNQGVMLYDLGRFEEALHRFDRALAFKPDYHTVLFNRGLTLHALGRVEEAVEAYDARLRAAPDDAQTWYALSVSLESLPGLPQGLSFPSVLFPALPSGEDSAIIDLRIAALEKAIALRPDFPDAQVDLAARIKLRGDEARAEQLLHRSLEIDPDHAMAHFNLGLLMAQLGGYEQAVQAYAKAILLVPDDAHVHFNLGLALIKLGRYDDAVSSLEYTLALDPGFAEVWSNLGLCRARLGEDAAAREAFDKAFSLRPDAVSTYYNHGCALVALGRKEEARDWFLKALDADPENGPVHFELGLLYAEAGEHDVAFRHLDAARQRLKQDPEVHYNLGLVRQYQDLIPDAMAHFQDALALSPSHFGANSSLAPLLRQQGDNTASLPLFEAALAVREDDADMWYGMGLALYGLERYEAAVESLSRAVALRPEYWAAHNNLALTFQAIGRHEEALTHFQAYLRHAPEDDPISYSYGVSLLGADRHEEATRHFASLMERNPGNPQYYFQYGNSLAERGMLDQAVKAYRRTLLLSPEDLDAMNNLAFCLVRLGKGHEAFAWLNLAFARDPNHPSTLFNFGYAHGFQGCPASAEKFFRRVLAIQPNHAEAHLNLGVVLEARGEREPAVAAYQAALALDSELALAHHNLAGLLRDAGQREQALAHYQHALRLDPANPDTYKNKGFLLLDTGRAPEAETLFREAVNRSPDDPDAHLGLANTLVLRNALHEAREHYEKALEHAPDHASVLKMYAFLLMRLGETSAATDYFQRALALLPEDSGIHCGLADALFARGRFEEAERHYLKSLELHPEFALAHNNLGNLYVRLGRMDEAIAAYRKAITYDPESVETRVNLARIYLREQRHADAIGFLETALTLEPGNLRARVLLGDALLETGDREGATRAYQRVLLERPDWHEIREKLREASAQP